MIPLIVLLWVVSVLQAPKWIMALMWVAIAMKLIDAGMKIGSK